MNRRKFLQRFIGASALSLGALKELNAAIYNDMAALGQSVGDPVSPDGIYWEGIRKHYLFEDNLIMMNNGTVGPMPKPVFNTLMNYSEESTHADPRPEAAHQQG